MISHSAFHPALTVQIPASSANLGPGFDSLGLALDLHNRVLIAEAEDALPLVTVHTSDAVRTPSDETNITYVAARALFNSLGISANFRLEAWNNIPHGRGLGSSAAARVGGLVAANEWARVKGWRTADTAHLVALAAELEGHPDNAAAAIIGGLTVSGMTENGAVALPFTVARWPRFVVWIPNSELATSAAREALPEAVTHHDAVFNVTRTALLLAALASGDWSALPAALDDRLHQPQRGALIPDWEMFQDVARRVGAIGATISGSGSTLLLWLEDDAAQARAVEELRRTAAQVALQGHALALEVDIKGARLMEKQQPKAKRTAPADLPVGSDYVTVFAPQ